MKKHLDLDDHNNGVWQMPKMNGKYHTEFCLRYFIPNMIYNEHDRVYENSLYTMPELLNILLKIREYYNEYLLKVLKDNIINVFEGLSFDMQSILSPSFNNPRNINRAKGIRKIVNLPISRKEKIKMLMNFKYYNKFQEVIYPFLSSNKYKIIINSSYHFVKDTSLNPTEDNPNCVANGFFSKFKLSYGIYQVSNNSINFKNFCIIKNNSLKEIASQMHNILTSNYYDSSFDYCVYLIQNIKNENDINEWSNITPVTMWLHEFLTFSDFSMRLCHKLFSGTVFKLKKIIDEYDQILRQIVTDEIYVRKNLVKQFLTKSNRKELNEIIYSGKNPSNDITEQILKLYDSILKQSSKKILKYLEVYMSIISTMSKNIDAHILFNHMISRFSYFMDTRCYIDTEMNSRFFKTSRNYAFPMFSKSFSSILKKKKSKITDQLFIESYATQVKQIICEIDTEELEISDNYSEDIVIEYFSDDEPNEN
jgi:hypothetical protein